MENVFNLPIDCLGWYPVIIAADTYVFVEMAQNTVRQIKKFIVFAHKKNTILSNMSKLIITETQSVYCGKMIRLLKS